MALAWAARAHARLGLLALLLLGASLLAGCTRASEPPPLPPPPSLSAGGPTTAWNYAILLLQHGDDAQADQYLERAAQLNLDPLSHEAGEPHDDALFWRDVAEVRLAVGNADGARDAVSHSRQLLAGEPSNARFNADDRELFNRLLDALDAAARGDSATLATLADASPPLADPSYLAGWLAEQQHDLPAAQASYQRYLAEVPAWGFLRRTTAMRAHAQAVLGAA